MSSRADNTTLEEANHQQTGHDARVSGLPASGSFLSAAGNLYLSINCIFVSCIFAAPPSGISMVRHFHALPFQSAHEEHACWTNLDTSCRLLIVRYHITGERTGQLCTY